MGEIASIAANTEATHSITRNTAGSFYVYGDFLLTYSTAEGCYFRILSGSALDYLAMVVFEQEWDEAVFRYLLKNSRNYLRYIWKLINSSFIVDKSFDCPSEAFKELFQVRFEIDFIHLSTSL